VNVLGTIDVDGSAWRRKEPLHRLKELSCHARLSRCPVSVGGLSIRIVLLNALLNKDRSTFEAIYQLGLVLFLNLRESFDPLPPLLFKIDLFRFRNFNEFLSARKPTRQRVLVDNKSKLGLSKVSEASVVHLS